VNHVSLAKKGITRHRRGDVRSGCVVDEDDFGV
jgi:hypothetical protein